MKRSPRPETRSCLRTLGDWLAWAERQYAARGLSLGQVATTAHDEALYLLLRTFGLPLESGSGILDLEPTPAQAKAAGRVMRRRINDRVPAAYLTREAFLGDHSFYVDERVIIPRSYFLEIIPRLGRLRRRGAPPVARAADVCTGSGCLAILLGHQFSKARIDAIDISPAALEVARINVDRHRLGRAVTLHRSDVFDSVPPARYDLIVCNPPYEPSALMRALPPEFRKEPRLALDGGRDGLDVIRKLLRQSAARLADDGLLLIEVGGLRAAMESSLGHLHPRWIPTRDGSDCVCAIAGPVLRGAQAGGLL